MKEIETFAGQNWLITPAALAVNEARPQSISNQKWQLMLSGVAITDIKGKSSANWLGETLMIRPDQSTPLNHAITKYAIPRPSSSHSVEFQVEQWLPFAAISSIFNQNESINSGFSVNVWRPAPFGTGTDAFSGAALTKLFKGIAVDVAVRDSDAWLYRVSYHITLIGKIVFKQQPINE
jgi:hypothetical protein